LFAPVAYFFLFHHIETNNAGLSDWNKGEELEFFFHFQDGMSFVEKCTYTVKFYVHNFYLILQMNTAVFSEDHPWFAGMSAVLAGLFGLGMMSYFDTKLVRKKFLGIYFCGFLALWFALVALKKVTLSPTRHSLILLPFIAITVSEGIGYLIVKVQQLWGSGRRSWKGVQKGAYTLFTVLILIMFSLYYPTFLNERRDPFNETEIASLLKEYEVDTVIPALWALQVEMLKDVRDHYDYYGKKVIRGFKEYGLITNGVAPYKRIAWISHRQKLNPVLFEYVRVQLNRYIYLTNSIRAKRGEPPLDLMRYPATMYRVIYQKEIDSTREIEFSNITKSGINGYFVYILERVP
jgi:hypothetical protein